MWKILLGFLEHLPPEGQRNIEVDIIEANNNESLYKVSENPCTGLLLAWELFSNLFRHAATDLE